MPVLELGSARPSNKLPHCVGLPHPLPHPRKIQPVSQKLQFAQHTHRSSFPPTFPPEGYGTLIHHDQGSQISPRSYLRPEAPRIPAIEPLRAPRSISLSKPGEKVGSSNLFLAGGGKKSRRASAAEAAAGGEALVGPSRRPRIDLGSKVRPDRNSSRSYAPRVTAPPHTLHSRSRRARRPGSPRGPRTQGWPPPGGRRQVNGGPPPGGGAWRSGRDPRPPSSHSPRPPAPTLCAACCPARASAPSVRESRNR